MASPSPPTAGSRAAQASPSSPQASPAGSPAGSQTQAASRVKRNTACVHCRDSKVKCITNRVPNRPCTRCTKLQLACVVDRTHKRVSRRSKLEELEQEVRSIKEAVGKTTDPAEAYTRTLPLLHTRDGGGSDASWPAQQAMPPAILPPTLYPPQTLLPAPQQALPPTQHTLSPLPPTLPPMRPPFDAALSAPTSTPSTSAAVPSPKTLLSTASSTTTVQPRAIKSRAFSGEDIGYYFERYFEFFHPHLPVVRNQNPDACYEAAPLLFWTIVLTASRRFARDDTVLPFLSDALPGVLWGTVAQPPLALGAINALLLLCAWPLHTIRYFTDPSMMLASMAMVASFQLGLHTGRGDYTTMVNPRRFPPIGNDEAVYTWAALNLLSQRVASYMGFLPAGPFFNRTIEALLDGASPVAVPPSLRVHLACARFGHRVCQMMTASLEARRGIAHHVVDLLEADFDQLQQQCLCFVGPAGLADADRFTVLSTRLELQLFYLLPEEAEAAAEAAETEAADAADALFVRNVLKPYATAQQLIRLAGRLQAAAGFLRYAPHFVFRTLVTAAVVLVTVLLSPPMAAVPVADKDALVQDTLAAARACAIRDGELPARLAVLVETYWAAHRLRPPVPIPTTDRSPFAHHLSTRFALGYIQRWKHDIEAARLSATTTTDPTTGGPSGGSAAADAGAAAAGPPASADGPAMPSDSADLIDWDAFMDDFDWSFTPYLNPA